MGASMTKTAWRLLSTYRNVWELTFDGIKAEIIYLKLVLFNAFVDVFFYKYNKHLLDGLC